VRISRPVRIALQVLVSGGVLAYLIWQIDLRQTLDLIGSSNGWYLLASYVIFLVTTVGMAWRWKALLASKGIHEPLSWLTKLYFVGYAAGQVLIDSPSGWTPFPDADLHFSTLVNIPEPALGLISGAISLSLFVCRRFKQASQARLLRMKS